MLFIIVVKIKSMLETIRCDLKTSINIVKNAGHRVTISKNQNMLVIPGRKYNQPDMFGLKRYSLKNLNQLGTVNVHTNYIEDIKFHPNNSMVLSVAKDNNACLTDIKNNSVLCRVNVPSHPKTCTFNSSGTNYLIGDEYGQISIYDLRDNTKPTNVIPLCPNKTAVTSILVSNTENTYVASCTRALWQINIKSKINIEKIELKGSVLSTHFNAVTNNYLVSQQCNSTVNHCIYNGKRLKLVIKGADYYLESSKACLFTIGNKEYLISYDESEHQVCVCDTNFANNIVTFTPKSPVFDFCYYNSNLVCLCESYLEMYSIR